MKLVSFLSASGAPRPGILKNDTIEAFDPAIYPDMNAVLAAGDAALNSPTTSVPLSSVKLAAPIPNPSKILCVGLNYRDHAIESNMEIPKVPTIFSKYTNTIIGPGANIVLPKKTEKPDYEAEFAVVIGRRARNVKAADALDYVAGYTNLNDVSARDLQLATTQWLMGKSCDTFCPIGPAIVTKDEIADPHNLNISMTINGEVLQNSNTRELIFRIPELIEYITAVMTLEPGDIISTGTPSGVGFARKPPRLLVPGDVCTVEVEGLGQLINPVIAEA